MYIINPLTHVINFCIQKFVWPGALKTKKIVPIYRFGGKKLATNFTDL